MLDIKNIPVERINQNRKTNANFVRMKNQMDVKMASYLRYLGTKTLSTEPAIITTCAWQLRIQLHQ